MVSAGRPGELTPAKQVDVEVGDGLAAVRAVVNHHAESALRETEAGGDLRGGEKEMAEDGLIPGFRLADAGDGFVGHNQDVKRRLRGNIAEGEAMLVAVNHIGGDLPVADFLKNRLHSGGNLAGAGHSGKPEKFGRRAFPAHHDLRDRNGGIHRKGAKAAKERGALLLGEEMK
jgi:hypothetical protein